MPLFRTKKVQKALHQSKSTPIRQFRFVVLGASAVGKTSIVIQFIEKKFFLHDYLPTIEDEFRTVIDLDGKAVTLSILDTSGNEEFKPLRQGWANAGNYFIFVYSIADRGSFKSLEVLIDEILQARKKNEPACFFVVGNKSDLSAQRAVTQDEGNALARNILSEWREISAKNYEEVQEVFFSALRQMQQS